VTAPPGPAGPVRYCGRDFSPADIEVITGLAATLPTRAAIAEAACQALDWRRPDGQTKAMSARVACLRMAADGLITLPPPRRANGNGRIPRHRPAGQGELFETSPVTGTLASLGALTIQPVTTRAGSRTWNDLIATHHYLGYTPLAGAQLRYLVHAGQAGTVAAISFGASAWKCAARDTLIGWDPPAREARLHLITGNARFLILPHVRVPHLASAILGRVTRRLPADWRDAYGYAPVLAETFVETYRFDATSYRAANWIHAGRTQGRGKLDRNHQHALPVKDVYLYPLHRHWQRILTQDQ
jgi:Domain of unknown function (DUF4338)